MPNDAKKKFHAAQGNMLSENMCLQTMSLSLVPLTCWSTSPISSTTWACCCLPPMSMSKG